MFSQAQSGAPMQGGAGKGGIQQPMGGSGKGGMNRGPGGNAQNNPGGQQAGMNPGMHQFAQLGQQFNGLGSAGGYPPGAMTRPNMPGNPINSTANSVGQSMGGSPMGNWQSMLQQGGLPAFNFGGGGNPYNGMGRPDGFGGGGNMTPIQGLSNYGRPQQKPMPMGGLLSQLYGKFGG